MEIDVFQQIFEQVKKAGKILIVLPQNFTPDALASALGLKLFLLKLKKEADVATSGQLPEQLKFLPHSSQVLNVLPNGKSLVVVVDTSIKKLEELSYETNEHKASIFLKAKDGQVFSQEDISFAKERAPYDLVFTLDAASLSSLGSLFEQNPEVFYETAKINIDHKAENEFFGAINLVDLSATSVGEILAGVFEKFEEQLVDEDIATCLLTGIISKTDSFQHARTTPRAFLSASQLISLGGRQQDIVQSLYKTKPLHFLRLWGRVLARLKGEENQNLMYAVLNEQDFEKAGAKIEDLPQALLDLLSNTAGKLVVAILAPGQNESVAFVALHNSILLEKFSSLGLPRKTTALSPYPYTLYEFSLPGKISDVESNLTEIAKGL